MDFEEYRARYFTDPSPKPKYPFIGVCGATLFYQEYPAALAFFRQVFGEPAYVEGDFTHGWRIGESWLTVFPAKEGSPANLEVPVYLQTAEAVDALYAAFIAAGAMGDPPQNTLMYVPVYMTVVTDPFGVLFTLVCEV
ncbi:MAG: hypothetical protein P8046_13835 [Anaerolineales bacterium]|jgi:hypothetical protein